MVDNINLKEYGLDIMKMLDAQFRFNATFNKEVEEIKDDFIKPDTSGNSEQSDEVQKEPA